MRFLGLALISTSLAGLGVSVATAEECPQKESPIATDRPDVTNSSLVLPHGSFLAAARSQNDTDVDLSVYVALPECPSGINNEVVGSGRCEGKPKDQCHE
jgi:hypothetical protein